MSRKIKIPEGMLKAAMNSRTQIPGQVDGWSNGMTQMVLEAALRWLSVPENAMQLLPPKVLSDIRKHVRTSMLNETTILVAVTNALEHMFNEPEPEVPEDLQLIIARHFGANPAEWVKLMALEAFELGGKAAKS